MTTKELEQVIHDYIRIIYKKEYIGKLKVEALDPIGYKVSMDLGVPERPLVMCAQLEDDKFLKFIKEELKIKRFNLILYGELNLVYPSDCAPRNSACSCQKKN